MELFDFNEFGDFNVNKQYQLFYLNRSIGSLRFSIHIDPIKYKGLFYEYVNLYSILISNSNQKRQFGTRCIEQLLDCCNFYNKICIIPSDIISSMSIDLKSWLLNCGFRANLNQILPFEKSIFYKIPD
jgi:hypothetical protein